LYPGASCAGEVICVPIGIPRALTEKKRTGVVTFTDKEADLKLPERSQSGNKGTFGKVLLAAGSRSMGGACQLSALASYRIGAGMVRVFTAEENRESLLRKLPEAIVDTYADPDDEGILSEREQQTLIGGLEWAEVIAIGPGLSLSNRALDILQTVLERCDKPLVLDADALNLLAKNDALLQGLAFGRRRNDASIVLTPHLGEFARLMKYPVSEIKKDLLGTCKAFTKKYDVSLVCKDARTIITKRGKLTYLNSSGNNGMATAGSGDVLTGVIAGLLAQGMTGFEAAVIGAYAHGLAGDYARENASSYYIMAQDIINSLKYLK
ncbi:MAG: NAD(P)H-hydrate dehydratase, partial [Lachnospiraceae bacterium]|nr:NAD(P)H-hydrate dehydratase [Lachnospiraceae bacterium]